MDRRSTLIGIILIAAALFILFKDAQRQRDALLDQQEQQDNAPAQVENIEPTPFDENGQPLADESAIAADETAGDTTPTGTDTASPTALPTTTEELLSRDEIVEVGQRVEAPMGLPIPDEEIYVLRNDFIEVEFTTHGGAINRVGFLENRYRAEKPEDSGPYYFNNAPGRPPILEISERIGGGTDLEALPPAYVLQPPDPNLISVLPDNRILVDADSITFTLLGEYNGGIEIDRIYTIDRTELEGPTPYILNVTTRFANRSLSDRSSEFFFHLGTVEPSEADPFNYNLTAGGFDGEDTEFIKLGDFAGGNFFSRMFGSAPPPVDALSHPGPLRWTSVKNQFFVSLITSRDPAANTLIAQRYEFPLADGEREIRRGIGAATGFDLNIPHRSLVSLTFDYYVGPKEYFRLNQLQTSEEKVLNFGWFTPISTFLLLILTGLHGIVGNWGVAIVLITVIIRGALWPLTAKAAKTSKKMGKLQGPMKELQEKYKDNPEKKMREMQKLFKEHKVNPMAGCLPVLVQIPIFLAFFWMLRGAAELRFAEFLWIQDLSVPDTVATLGVVPINILPFFMSISMFYQMKMMPTPTVDPLQRKIFMAMPVVLFFISYDTFSSGLVLYWTMSNCFSILQQYLTNRRKNPEEEQQAEAAPTPVIQSRKKKKKKDPNA